MYSSLKMPVFIISYNRGKLVFNFIESMRHLDSPFDFIVHDNGSDDRETIFILKQLEKHGIASVKWNEKITNAEQLNNVNNTIIEYFQKNQNPSTKYIVSDCDIDLRTLRRDAIAVFCELLDQITGIQCVGPMLKIEDIPKDYALYNHVMNRHIHQFWKNIPTIIETSAGEVAFQPCLIDTTFAVHRKGEQFKRLKTALRIYHPFEARHLDWYLCEKNSEDDYSKSSSQYISHWNNDKYTIEKKTEPLIYDRFYTVKSQPTGKLSITAISLNHHS